MSESIWTRCFLSTFAVLSFFVDQGRAQDLLRENFESMKVGVLTSSTPGALNGGQNGWYLQNGHAALAQIIQNPAIAHSPSQCLQLRDGTGANSCEVAWVSHRPEASDTITDQENNSVSLFFREESVMKSGLYINVFGNGGSGCLAKAFVQIGGKQFLIASGGNIYDVTLAFARPLQDQAWYKLAMFLTPGQTVAAQSVTYTLSDASGNILLTKTCPMSATFAFKTLYGLSVDNGGIAPSNIEIDDILLTGAAKPATAP